MNSRSIFNRRVVPRPVITDLIMRSKQEQTYGLRLYISALVFRLQIPGDLGQRLLTCLGSPHNLYYMRLDFMFNCA